MFAVFCPRAGPDPCGPAPFSRRLAAVLLSTFFATMAAAQSPPPWAARVDLLIKAYPDFLERAEGGDLVWKDGTRGPIDDGKGEKDFESWLDGPDIADQFRFVYPLGRTGLPPPPNSDPGRARNKALFEKMYGRCAPGEKLSSLVTIEWLPNHGAQKLGVTRVNGVAGKLAAVSAELDRLPARFLEFLKPSAGTYNCRAIAGTERASAHGYGIAIDLAVKHADYWRWNKPGASGAAAYKNRIPWEIVEIFERHGFIWGGKWSHFDTMHFEYRPELIAAARAAGAAQ